jgi:hypothetical protein
MVMTLQGKRRLLGLFHMLHQAGSLTPLISLPVKLGLRQQKLLSYCKLHPITGIAENNLLVQQHTESTRTRHDHITKLET